jgi:hypothetical protein
VTLFRPTGVKSFSLRPDGPVLQPVHLLGVRQQQFAIEGAPVETIVPGGGRLPTFGVDIPLLPLAAGPSGQG